ncbi:MAG: hypothetical protein B6244_06885 [Candidatus Cloacimonetes bacterium 4572_55]|nr:MAG: hypothetical protein B6244_06885 [Candidatus Cloacimonetes bacterium 4572_55]
MGIKKVLIVDDEAHIRDILKLRLQIAGFKTVDANCGKQAIKIIPKENPDLVILDVMMPDIDGWEVCRYIRNQPEVAHVLIVMLTAKNEIRDRELGIQVGVNGYVTKPFSPNELVERIRKLESLVD